MLERLTGAPTITNDGVSIAREIELSDQYKNMGAQLVREVANRTSDLTGDGTTTATLLAQAIVREGMRALDAGANPMLLRRGIEQATDVLAAELRRSARPVEGAEALRARRHARRQGGRGDRRRGGGGAASRRARGRRHPRGERRAGARRRLRRGHARGERLDLALHGARPGAHGDGVRGPAHLHDQQAALAPERPAAGARSRRARPAAARGARREGRRRRARDAGGQHAAPHDRGGRRAGAGLRPPARPAPRRPRGVLRRRGDRRGGRPQARGRARRAPGHRAAGDRDHRLDHVHRGRRRGRGRGRPPEHDPRRARTCGARARRGDPPGAARAPRDEPRRDPRGRGHGRGPQRALPARRGRAGRHPGCAGGGHRAGRRDRPAALRAGARRPAAGR